MTDESKVNRIGREAYRAYPELNPDRPRVARLLASALAAGVIGATAAAGAAIAQGGGQLNTPAIVLIVFGALGAAAKDYKTYMARPPVHGDARRP